MTASPVTIPLPATTIKLRAITDQTALSPKGESCLPDGSWRPSRSSRPGLPGPAPAAVGKASGERRAIRIEELHRLAGLCDASDVDLNDSGPTAAGAAAWTAGAHPAVGWTRPSGQAAKRRSECP